MIIFVKLILLLIKIFVGFIRFKFNEKTCFYSIFTIFTTKLLFL